jgi:flagellar protein FlaG
MNMKASPVPAVEPIQPPVVPEPPEIEKVKGVEPTARYRLVIEKGPAPGTFVYKTLNPETGEVVQQLPREDVVRLKDQPEYGPGKVIDTTA